MNIEELKDWRDSARRGLEYEIDRLKEKEVQLSDCLRAELLEMKDQRLAQEPAATATEIHNHFESGSSAQVFNDKVTGRFAKKKRWKRKTR